MTRGKITATLLIVLVVTVVLGGYGFYTYYATGNSIGACPSIFANVSYQNATGFVTITHPSQQMIEFVLRPGGRGQLDVTYSSATSNLTAAQVGGGVPAWPIGPAGTSFQPSADVSVQASGLNNQSGHSITVHYIITAGKNESLYLLGIPSTCRGAFLNVGLGAFQGAIPGSSSTYG
jgi:hypothetical protein